LEIRILFSYFAHLMEKLVIRKFTTEYLSGRNAESPAWTATAI